MYIYLELQCFFVLFSFLHFIPDSFPLVSLCVFFWIDFFVIYGQVFFFFQASFFFLYFLSVFDFTSFRSIMFCNSSLFTLFIWFSMFLFLLLASLSFGLSFRFVFLGSTQATFTFFVFLIPFPVSLSWLHYFRSLAFSFRRYIPSM